MVQAHKGYFQDDGQFVSESLLLKYLQTGR